MSRLWLLGSGFAAARRPGMTQDHAQREGAVGRAAGGVSALSRVRVRARTAAVHAGAAAGGRAGAGRGDVAGGVWVGANSGFAATTLDGVHHPVKAQNRYDFSSPVD